MIATMVALLVLVVIGTIAWPVARGIPGIGIAGLIGAATGPFLPSQTSGPARVSGGLLGGLVAGFFAIASGELHTPGTIDWALSGGALGAAFGLPLAAVAAVLAELPFGRTGETAQPPAVSPP
jgi:hypothetical protein